MKRKILSLLFTVLMLNVYSQTSLDYKVFEKINEYRVENGLNELIWCEKTFLSVEVHTKYMIVEGRLSHTENSTTPKFTDRLMVFVDNDYILGNENVSMVSINGIEDSIDDIAEKIVNSWKVSKGHNKAMLNKKSNVGAVNCGNSIFTKNNYDFKVVYSTFVLWLDA